MSDEILIEVQNGVAWITVNRPEVRNALSMSVTAELAAHFRRLAADRSIRVFVLKGAGDRVFISGADVREFRDKLSTPTGALEYDASAETLQSAIKAAAQPVVAMIQGHAVGSGCIVAVACDFRIASRTAKFGIPVAKFGFISALPDTLRLVQLVGPAKAKMLLMTSRIITADEAEAIGLVDQVTDPKDLLHATESLVVELLQSSPLTQKSAKQMIEHFSGVNADVYRGAPWYQEIFRSRDFQEGLDAFFSKRKPIFRGE